MRKGHTDTMKKLLIYLRDYKKETVFAPLFKMLEATFELFVPLVMAAIIDRGIGQADTGYVLKTSATTPQSNGSTKSTL